MKFLVTGAAGFIGFHTTRKLLARGEEVVGLDNLNEYYDVTLKKARLAQLEKTPGFRFVKLDLGDQQGMAELFAREKFQRVIHLAAQAGVRYSIDVPHAYVHSNVTGTLNVLEGCRHNTVEHLTYASTSSVYGANTNMPFSPHNIADHPLSLYAATKRANELMAHNFSALFKLPTTGLRFFTVYGPWGRPDMALFKFTRAILDGQPIDIYNDGEMTRDFTYIDDLVEAIVRLIEAVPGSAPLEGDTLSPVAPFRIVNIGGGQPVQLMDYIAELERALGRTAAKNFLPMQPGDLHATAASLDLLRRLTGPLPATPLAEGIRRFVEWYREFYGVPG
jgi:UDP-glucuronate 4-epimerase